MTSNRRNLIILFYTMVVIMLGFGMVIPILPFYIKSMGASGTALGALMATYAVMQFIFAPVWGSLSDRYGRRPILMVGILGNALAQLIFGLSTHLWMLFAARTLAGILSSATLPTAMAFIGDSTSERDRGGGMGMMGAAMGVGMLLGPGIAGFLATRWLALPFLPLRSPSWRCCWSLSSCPSPCLNLSGKRAAQKSRDPISKKCGCSFSVHWACCW